MSREESASVWKKKEAQESLRDDRKHAFQKHEEVVKDQRRNTTVHDQRVQSHEDARARWTGQSAAPRTPGGNLAGDELAQLQKKAHAGHTAQAATPTEINPGTVAACIAFWKQNWPNGKLLYELFEDNDWTREQLTNATQHLLQRGHAVDVQLAEDAFQLCYAGNHLDPKKRRDRAGNIIYLRGEARRPAPVPFPRVIWPDEAAAIQREQGEKAAAAAAAEAARARSMPFDQLRTEAVKGRKTERPQMGPVISVGN
jgi:hypothetical protein